MFKNNYVNIFERVEGMGRCHLGEVAGGNLSSNCSCLVQKYAIADKCKWFNNDK